MKRRTRRKHKRIKVEHYCKKCGKLYNERMADGHSDEPNLMIFKDNYCKECEKELGIKLSNNNWN